MSIEQQNRMIADFMGAELHGDDWHIEGRDMTVNNKKFPQSLRYHVSWDWLMPVVVKISHTPLIGAEDHKDVCYPITFNMPTEDGKVMVRLCGFQLHTADTLIEATYAAVVDFIQFENENNGK